MNTFFTFMGTAAGCGVPSFFCECPACMEARENPKLSRGDCGCVIRTIDNCDYPTKMLHSPISTLAIDTPPDARSQLLRENIRFVDAILLTHCHFDHIGGLGEYEYMVQLKASNKKLPVYASKETIESVSSEFHYMTYCLDFRELKPFECIKFGDVSYTALPVQHAPGTYGYLINTPSTKMFYASDTGPLPQNTSNYLQDLDIIAMDATFWGNNWSPNNHHSVQECIDEALKLNPKKIYLTHLCMHYDTPITYKELSEYISKYNGKVEIALDGMTFEI